MLGWVIAMIVLAVLGGYILTSVLLLKYPLVLHKKKDIRFRAVHISHRGGAGENLENTMAAFRHAVKLDTDMLEIDCHITRDGQVVVTHDEDLTRVTGHAVTVLDTSYESLPLLKESLKLDFQHCHETLGGVDRQIPLLRQVFEEFPDLPINIDIKIDNDELIQKVSDLISEFKRETITVWGSRSSRVTAKCLKQNPRVSVLFSLTRVLQLVLLFYTGLLPFVPLRESFYEVIMPSILLKDGRFRMVFSRKQRFLMRFIDCLLMNRALIAHLKARGIQTYFWVLNDDDEFERAFHFGVSGVMTDFPTKLTVFLDRHPHLWPKANANRSKVDEPPASILQD